MRRIRTEKSLTEKWGFFIAKNKYLITKMNKEHSIFFYYITGWIGMIFGSLTLSDWAVIIGMFATIFGLIVTWVYRHLEYQLRKKKIEQVDEKKFEE